MVVYVPPSLPQGAGGAGRKIVVEGCDPNEARRVRVQLIRVHEDGTCARWRTEPGDLSLVLVIPARRPRKATGVAS